ncbi:ATP-binding cassette domain-containing protein [Jiangella alba]|uniref:ABC transporter n=1 Tax=Jiangella alba TaxID=561176 RepID=A0A1H5LCP6_9ACTN|nr:ATP-binding cassette domain-containing protein [Jiangella alba]SEE74327.1 ABC transporter [Jiangella alba]
MTEPLLDVRDLAVTFTSGRSWGGDRGRVHAVRGVDLSVRAGEAFALVGESGSGKSTTAKCVAGLQRPTRGSITFAGAPLDPARDRGQRRAIQMIFQDPYSSLNPRMTIGAALIEILRVHRLASGRAAAERRAAELLDLVGMPRSALDQRPRAFSGGQRQRLGIARALAVEPSLLVADEPVSALDVSIQASVLLLLKQLQRELGLTMLFISHDLAVVRQLCDRVAVMADGLIVEEGTVGQVLTEPSADFTRTLLAAATDLPPLDLDLEHRQPTRRSTP